MADSSLSRQVLTGAALGGASTASLSYLDATPTQRVAIPAALGLFMAVVLPDDLALATGMILGAVGVGGGVSASEGGPFLEFLPPELRPGEARAAIQRRREARRGRGT